jgi:hypothetical protein
LKLFSSTDITTALFSPFDLVNTPRFALATNARLVYKNDSLSGFPRSVTTKPANMAPQDTFIEEDDEPW